MPEKRGTIMGGIAPAFVIVTVLISLFLHGGRNGAPEALAAGPLAATTVTFPSTCDALTGHLTSYDPGVARYVSGCSNQNWVEWSSSQNKSQRTFVSFDTSSIPPPAVITSATLRFFVAGGSSFANDDGTTLELVSASQGTSLALDDWNRVGSTSLASRALADLQTSELNTLPLNAAGLSAISKGATSQFALRLGLDLNGQTPRGANYLMTALGGDDYKWMKLLVTYDIPSPTPTATSTPTPTPSPTPTDTPTATATPTPSPTPSSTPTATPAPVASPAATSTVVSTPVSSVTPVSFTVTATPTASGPPSPPITPTMPPGYSQDKIPLAMGWNLISIPSPLQDPSVSAVFAQNPQVTRAYTSQSGGWVYTSRGTGGWSGGLNQIVDGTGYYVYTTEPVTLTLQRKQADPLVAPPSYPLPSGWSLIGYTSSLPKMPVDTYLKGVEGKWTSLYRFDAIKGWEVAKPGGLGFTEVEWGRGYWINLTEPGTLVP